MEKDKLFFNLFFLKLVSFEKLADTNLLIYQHITNTFNKI